MAQNPTTENIDGTLNESFGLDGGDGPQLKHVSDVMEVRNSDDTGYAELYADAVRLLYAADTNQYGEIHRTGGNLSIDVGGTDAQALYLNSKIANHQLGGTTSAQYFVVSNGGDQSIFAARADLSSEFFGPLTLTSARGGVQIISSTTSIGDVTCAVLQAGTYTATLPSAEAGRLLLVERQGTSGNVTIAPAPGDTIDGGTSFLLNAGLHIFFAEDATDWRYFSVDGYATISAYDSVGGLTFTTGVQTIPFNTAHVIDDGFSVAAGVITCVEAGRYRVSWSSSILVTNANQTLVAGAILANGAYVNGTLRYITCVTTNHGGTLSGSIELSLSAGDTLELAVSRILGSGTLTTVAGGSTLLIRRIK